MLRNWALFWSCAMSIWLPELDELSEKFGKGPISCTAELRFSFDFFSPLSFCCSFSSSLSSLISSSDWVFWANSGLKNSSIVSTPRISIPTCEFGCSSSLPGAPGAAAPFGWSRPGAGFFARLFPRSELRLPCARTFAPLLSSEMSLLLSESMSFRLFVELFSALSSARLAT